MVFTSLSFFMLEGGMTTELDSVCDGDKRLIFILKHLPNHYRRVLILILVFDNLPLRQRFIRFLRVRDGGLPVLWEGCAVEYR